jgi:hypothetical protein
MRNVILGGWISVGLLSGILFAGSQKAEASRPYKPVTKLDCDKCHTKGEKATDDKDLNACGKKSYDLLKKAGYKRTTDAGEQKDWARKVLKGFKCD